MNYELIEKNNKKVFLIDMTKENNKTFSEIAWKWIKKYINQNKKIWIIVNKKWFSTWIICNDCWNIPKCSNCDIPIAYHLDNNGNYFWLCHICKTQYNEEGQCSNCWSYEINKYWYWTERIQQILKKDFNINSFIVQSETVNSNSKAKNLINNLGKNNIIIWTSILSRIKKVDFDLIIFLNADLGLNLPDFNSAYKNFLFLYEGIKNINCSNFIIQSFNTDSHSIKYAATQKFEEFKKEELEFRKNFDYPPYNNICKIMYKDEIEETLFNKISELNKELLFLKEKLWFTDIEIYSTPAIIYKAFNKYRYNIILKWRNLENFIDIAYWKLKIQQKWFKIDREPDSLL